MLRCSPKNAWSKVSQKATVRHVKREKRPSSPPPPAPRRPAPQEIIGPLLAALPENDKRKTLQDVYSKAQKAKNGSADSAQGGGLTGLFGWGSKPATKAPAAAAAPKKAAGRGGAAAGGAEPYAFAEAKLSAADFQVFKTRTALFARGGINAR